MKALVYLAKNAEKGALRISEISDNEQIPRKFLEAILLELRNKGILGSKMGIGGGYYLAKPAAEIMMSDVMRITGGPIALLPCVSLNFYERCEECQDEAICSLRHVVMEVRDASLQILNSTSLADLAGREKSLEKKKKQRK